MACNTHSYHEKWEKNNNEKFKVSSWNTRVGENVEA